MKVADNKLLVSCDLEQKNKMKIGDTIFKTATVFNKNYRERSPVVAQSKETKGEIAFDDILLCHHNHFYNPSPFYLFDNLFAIPFSTASIFAVLDKNGNAKGVCGNILAEEIEVESLIELPPEMRMMHKNRAKIISDAYNYKKGEIIFTRPSAPYEIVYFWNDIERRIIKVNSEMILGVLKE